ncbi:enoyl-CoA hydratase [Neptunicella sp. SCSIO 80796]|uniref:enoyl-CoA hydratase n=1 Tax=Neptunicella plasticusilytica TaxID=3117012 RepID=UPI003A4E2A19
MSHIKLVQHNHCLTISMNRIDRKNSLTFAMYQQMADALIDAEQDKSIRAILIKGEGDCFTAGNDLADFATASEHLDIGKTVSFMRALMNCSKPVVAQVHGLAVGIGTTMLLHCDLVYCAKETQFILPFINLALVPEYAASYILPRLAGHRKAAQWLMLGEPFDAQQAESFGLVSQVLESAELDGHITQVLDKLVSKPHQAMLHTKALMKSDKDAVIIHMDEELDVFLQQLESEAAKEAFSAFLQKRQPDPTKYN